MEEELGASGLDQVLEVAARAHYEVANRGPWNGLSDQRKTLHKWFMLHAFRAIGRRLGVVQKPPPEFTQGTS
jgi:hypothetical protein